VKRGSRLRLSRRHLVTGVIALVWIGLLLGAAVPTWQGSLRKGRELRQIEEQLADLQRWSVSGLWLERTLAQRGPAVETKYRRLIPARRDKEQLFLELARVADRSGVAGFDLREEERPQSWLAQDPDLDDVPPLDPDDPVAVEERPLPSIPLQTYRVQARFRGDFPRIARFLAELRTIPRILSLHSLVARSATEGVEVELELDFYVDESL
jgi:hypothetical protein